MIFDLYYAWVPGSIRDLGLGNSFDSPMWVGCGMTWIPDIRFDDLIEAI